MGVALNKFSSPLEINSFSKNNEYAEFSCVIYHICYVLSGNNNL